MTSYTAIANGDIDQDSPVTQPLVTALRDNPIAIIEGATGAPRIRGNSIAIVNSMPTLTVAAANTFSLQVSANPRVGTANANIDTASTSLVVAYEWTFPSLTGSCRVKFTHSSSNALGTSTARVEKNNVLVQEWSVGDVGANRSVDVSFVAGDVISIKHRISNASYFSRITNGDMLANDGYTTRLPLIAFSDVSDL
jgi:hypothetical protein